VSAFDIQRSAFLSVISNTEQIQVQNNQYICNRHVAVAQHNNEHGGKVNGTPAQYSEAPVSNICPLTASPKDLPQAISPSPPIKHRTLPETGPQALFSTPFTSHG
jgi:hypothetical protein